MVDGSHLADRQVDQFAGVAITNSPRHRGPSTPTLVPLQEAALAVIRMPSRAASAMLGSETTSNVRSFFCCTVREPSGFEG